MIKWSGAVVTVLLVVVWVGSGWGSCTLKESPGIYVQVGGGEVGIIVPDEGSWRQSLGSASGLLRGGLRPPRYARLPFHLRSDFWWPDLPGGRYILLPLWPPAALSLLATATAWRLDTLARRRERVGFCPKCGYDRTGLVGVGGAAGAVCPECGAGAPSKV